MPYTITTYNEARDGVPMEDQTHADLDGTTVTTVATLDEAREAATAPIHRARMDGRINRAVERKLHDEICGLLLDGGTIGPLPDGTVIEVRRVEEA